MLKLAVKTRPHLRLERIMAVIATINLGLVLFDWSYIPWRDFYLRNVPTLTRIYDKIKGIEPHRDTENYVIQVRNLAEQVALTGLDSPEVENILQTLRNSSKDIIDTNPFAIANKTGTLEKIKNRMRDRLKEKSAKQAFATFWSVDYLRAKGWTREYQFYQSRIEPLLLTNYFRQIGEHGDFIDWFWLIDLPFVSIFALEMLTRCYFIRRKYKYSWIEAFLWRWYDWFLLLPVMRWLRIIPVTIRLDKAQLINLYPVRKLVHQGVVANFAAELTEIVIVRVINQIQGSIRRGDLSKWVKQQQHADYIDINQVNEIETILQIFLQTFIYKVLPQIQPELIAILHHNINRAVQAAPIYQNLQNLPGISNLQNQLNEQLATQIANNLYQALLSSVEDPVSGQLANKLMERLTSSLAQEMQQQHVTSELQNLIFDFLEEVKINYIQRLSQEDIQTIIEQTRQLHNQSSNITTVVSK